MSNRFVLIGAGSGAGMGQLAPFIIIGVLFYFMLIRPQQRQRREQQAMLSAVKTGDKVMTVGGIFGMVTNVKDDTVTVKIADNVKIELSRGHISRVVEKAETNE